MSWIDDGMTWHRPQRARGCLSAASGSPDISRGTPEFIAWANWMRAAQVAPVSAKAATVPAKAATEGPMKTAIGLLTSHCGVQPGLVATIKAQAKAAGISISTLKRAKKFLGLRHIEKDGQSFWALAAGVDP
jgi:hypothetical protein